MSTTATPPASTQWFECIKEHPRNPWKVGQRFCPEPGDEILTKSFHEGGFLKPIEEPKIVDDMCAKAFAGLEAKIQEFTDTCIQKSLGSFADRISKMQPVKIDTNAMVYTGGMVVNPGQQATAVDSIWSKLGIRKSDSGVCGPTLDGRWLSMGHWAKCSKEAQLNPSIRHAFEVSMKEHFDIVRKSQGIVQKAELPTGVMGEIITTDGEALVPPQYSNQIWERVYMNQLLQLTDSYPIMSSSMTFIRNEETSRATGSRKGGVRGYRLEEGDTFTVSKPTYGTFTVRPHKIGVLMGSTDELLEDAAAGGIALEALMTRAAGEEFNFMIGDDIINGNGVKKMLGVLNNAAFISVSKETGQAASTIVSENIFKMWTRMWAPSRMNSIWLHNQDIEPQLFSMNLAVGTGGVVTYLPPGGLANSPFATLMGRPMLATEFNPTLGTVGDLILVDLSQMLTVTRGGVRSAISIHYYFDTEKTAFRFSFRVGGDSWWKSALTPKNGSSTQSPFIGLATRS